MNSNTESRSGSVEFPAARCWCGAVATVRNHATDASNAHLACDEHAKDTGFDYVPAERFQFLATGYNGCHVAQASGLTVCGLEDAHLVFAHDMHGGLCRAALDTNVVTCEWCSEFATRLWAAEQLMQEDRDAAAEAYGPQLDGADTPIGELSSILHRLNAMPDIDEEDDAHDALTGWVHEHLGLEFGDESWEPIFSTTGLKVVGITARVAGLDVRYQLSTSRSR